MEFEPNRQNTEPEGLIRDWEGKPYNPISLFYRGLFGSKVFKVPVALADDCPNRRGLKGMETCNFCDVHGSFAYPENANKELKEQIDRHMKKVGERCNTDKFLIYFQAYTTTFLQLKRLKEAFDIALSYDNVVGLVVGTRPDCLSPAVMRTWEEYAQKTFVAVEVGVQSFDNKQLDWMKRGHDRQQSITGLHRISENCPSINLGVHLMFGWPGEQIEDVIDAAKICNHLPIHNVKLHNLHVLKETPLAELHARGEFEACSLDNYSAYVGAFLGHLRQDIAVHRLAALASRWDELVAPDWARHRMRNFQYIIDYLNDRDIFQGKSYEGQDLEYQRKLIEGENISYWSS